MHSWMDGMDRHKRLVFFMVIISGFWCTEKRCMHAYAYSIITINL